MSRERRWLLLHAGVVLFAFAAAYWTVTGGGFISDDFRWLLESRIRRPADLLRPFVDTTGFFRPAVSLVFGVTEYVAGPNPRAFGMLTLAFALACAAAVFGLARALRLPAGAALAAAAIWLLNPHGINMAILWISGLTALCLVLFATLTAIATSRGHWTLAIGLFFLALLSKEEAVLLPIPLLLIAAWPDDDRPRRAIWPLAAGFVAAEALYFFLRRGSDAMTPGEAPSYYRFTFAIGDLLSNAAQYADRSLTLAAVAVLITAAIVRARPRFERVEVRAIAIGITWLAVGFGITLFLPVRSSLYALFPSVGGLLAAGAVTAALWRRASAGQRRAIQVTALLLPIALAPVLRTRTARWTELSQVTRLTLAAVVPSGIADAMVFIDDRSRRDNLDNAFGSLLPDALELYGGTRPEVWLVPPPEDGAVDAIARVPDSVAVGWRYLDGRLERADRSEWAGAAALRLR